MGSFLLDLAKDGQEVGMDLRPTAVEVDADEAHAVAEEGHLDRGAVIDSGDPPRGWQ